MVVQVDKEPEDFLADRSDENKVMKTRGWGKGWSLARGKTKVINP